MAAALTYSTLITQLPSYMERSDAKYSAQIPYIVMLAENRLATDMKQQGFQNVVRGNLPMTSSLAKPAFWRETISFTYKDPVLGWSDIKLRTLEYIKKAYPLQSATAAPRFYADYNATNFYLGPTPSAALEFELAYYARLDPLDLTNETNWLTANAPQALLYACILESQLWAKNTAKAQEWEGYYNTAKGGLLVENLERTMDKNEVAVRG